MKNMKKSTGHREQPVTILKKLGPLMDSVNSIPEAECKFYTRSSGYHSCE